MLAASQNLWPTLTSIGVSAGYDRTMNCLEEFIVEDAPCLKRILYHQQRGINMQLQVSVISAPNLETLGCLNRFDFSSRLKLGSMIIEVPLGFLPRPINVQNFHSVQIFFF